jgi:predicted CXXCH cytochrome family protein
VAWAAILLATVLLPAGAGAAVKGPCYYCHTMHNSQNANSLVHVDEDMSATFPGWNAADATSVPPSNFGGGDPIENALPRDQLLVSDCVGCHTNTGAATIVNDIYGNKIPIVFNTNGYPTGAEGFSDHPLAGGNFAGVYGVGNDGNGHNVRGISNDDPLATAPGSHAAGCASSCHIDLTLSDTVTSPPDGNPKYKYNGCRGCHLPSGDNGQVGHHTPDASDTAYRFLRGHAYSLGGILEVYRGINGSTPYYDFEDNDWEQTKSATDHNFYMMQFDAEGKNGRDEAPIGLFCRGCHLDFHAQGMVKSGSWDIDNGGDTNREANPDQGGANVGLIVSKSAPVTPWLRHPTNVNIPWDGEYAILFGPTPEPYNPDIPVAQDPWEDPDAITPGDQVMCLSCHRAHASDQPDALRFVYSDIEAHPPGGGSLTNGCFWCHRTKDDE